MGTQPTPTLILKPHSGNRELPPKSRLKKRLLECKDKNDGNRGENSPPENPVLHTWRQVQGKKSEVKKSACEDGERVSPRCFSESIENDLCSHTSNFCKSFVWRQYAGLCWNNWSGHLMTTKPALASVKPLLWPRDLSVNPGEVLTQLRGNVIQVSSKMELSWSEADG